MKKLFVVIAAAAAIFSCNRSGKEQVAQYRSFPKVEIPSMITDNAEMASYALSHYWDAFFAEDGVTDSAAVLGVQNKDLEMATATYLQIATMVPKAEGQKAIGKLFQKIESKQASDTSSHVYLLLTELVSQYLYDPNSPYRDEDLYLPFVRGMAASKFTKDNVRPGYVFEEKMCSLNQYGTPATDFRFKDIKGRVHNLYGVKADYTLLFFSNPGCESCAEIKETLQKSVALTDLIEKGKVAIVNIYIDQELDKWREFVPNYPKSWISGYDYEYIIRQNAIYNVRAIPSVYLLGPGKEVLLKDAPVENIMNFIINNI